MKQTIYFVIVCPNKPKHRNQSTSVFSLKRNQLASINPPIHDLCFLQVHKKKGEKIRALISFYQKSCASDTGPTRNANLPNLETVLRDAGGVSLEVEEPRDRVEGAQSGGDGRVLQTAEQQHDEEHGHHLQRVLMPPLHSQGHTNRQEFRAHSSSSQRIQPRTRAINHTGRGWRNLGRTCTQLKSLASLFSDSTAYMVG